MKLSRRSLVFSAAGLGACTRRLAKRFNGYCFVANEGDRSVAAINLTRFKVEKRFPLESAPSAVLGIPGTRSVIAFSPDNATLTEIDAESLSVTRHTRAGKTAREMHLSPDGSTLWVLAEEPRAFVPVHVKSFRSGTPVKLPASGASCDLDLEGRFAAITMPTAKATAIVDLKDRKLAHQVSTPGEPGPVKFRSDGKQVLIGNPAARAIAIADTLSGRTLVNLPLALAPERFCSGTDGGQMFVSGRGMDAVAILYPYQTVVAETILAGRNPGAMAVNETQLFVANPESGDVTVINIEDRQVMAKIPVGQEPVSISLTDDNEYMLVLNRKSCDMAVVRLLKINDYRYKRAGLFTLVPVGDSPVSAAICHL